MTTELYRAVCEAEFLKSLASGRLSLISNSLEGKWFAEDLQDAVLSGVELTRLGGKSQNRILAVRFPSEAADRFFRIALLDGIGPARFAEANELNLSVSIQEAKP
ncbi:MAG TPA: hypothetical protein VG326_10135 [Tepidisphaeraceae bacterium]|jgi:hypothetical protein|nr:hypothetical protein [Tepidisphaeraceae bacterium]